MIYKQKTNKKTAGTISISPNRTRTDQKVTLPVNEENSIKKPNNNDLTSRKSSQSKFVRHKHSRTTMMNHSQSQQFLKSSRAHGLQPNGQQNSSFQNYMNQKSMLMSSRYGQNGHSINDHRRSVNDLNKSSVMTNKQGINQSQRLASQGSLATLEMAT